MTIVKCATEFEHRWKLRNDQYSYVCVICDEQRFELLSKSSGPNWDKGTVDLSHIKQDIKDLLK